jgi:hypothetical protein
MMELNDYSGPFKPDLKFDDFSKDFLLKLMRVWQRSWLQLNAGWFDEIVKRFGILAAYECDLEMWTRVAEECNPRYARIANIEPKSVVDSLKVLQLPLDNTMGEYPSSFDIKNENYAIATTIRCPSLVWCEKNAPERIEPMCRVNELKIMSRYIANPNIRITALKMPPRESPEEVACQWEHYRWVPNDVRVRSKEEVVDERTDIPEIDDLSGPFYPNLRHENFSKKFLLRLMDAWQYAWIVMSASYYNAVRKRFGFEAANDINRLAWSRVGERAVPRHARVANIQLNTVLDSLKVLQLPLNNTIGPLYEVAYDIRNENHVILNVTRCRSLLYYEREAPEMVEPVCRGFRKEAMEKHLINPNIKVTPLKLPPRKSKRQIACQWEFKMKE